LLGGILVLLWMLDVSLESEKGFAFIGMGFWETLQGGRTSAHVSIALSVILIILAGIWLW